jgi:hypothetical protein
MSMVCAQVLELIFKENKKHVDVFDDGHAA